MSQRCLELDQNIVWNFPIEITFKTTNVFGWPRMALSVYGLDFLGRDVIKGYGSVLLPPIPGRYNLHVDLYTPLANSNFNTFFSWLVGNPPEFYDSRIVCQGANREVTRTQKTGSVLIHINIVTKGEWEFPSPPFVKSMIIITID